MILGGALFQLPNVRAGGDFIDHGVQLSPCAQAETEVQKNDVISHYAVKAAFTFSIMDLLSLALLHQRGYKSTVNFSKVYFKSMRIEAQGNDVNKISP